MKKILATILIIYSSSVFAQSNLVGIWETGEENTNIEISEIEGRLSGILKSTDNKKAEIGRVILKDLEQKGSKWEGQIWAARRQRWFDVLITPTENLLELEIDAGFRTKSVEWKRQT